MKRRGRPPKTVPPPQLALQEEQSGSSGTPHEHVPPPDLQAQAQQMPPPNTPAQQVVLQQVQPQVQQEQSAASVHGHPPPPQAQQLPPQVPQPPPPPQVFAAQNIPAPAGVAAPVVPVAGIDPAMFAQMLQLQTTLLQALVAKEHAPAAPPAPPQEPKAGTIRDFNSFNPPVFSGHESPEEADDWLRRIHYLLLASHIPEADMVVAARTKMDKMAGAWIASETKIRGEVMSWTEFKDLFQQKFIPPSSQRQMMLRFVALTQGDGDVLSYTNQFETLRTYATEILPTEETRIEWYINGLNNRLKPLVRACNPTTLLQAQQKALQMEQDAGEASGTKPVAQKKSVGQFAKAGSSVSARTVRSLFQARPAVSTASVTQRPRLPITCTACGKKGHKSTECWRKHNRCLRCGSASHKIAECLSAEGRGVQTVAVSQPSASVTRGRAPLVPAARPASGLGRGSAPASVQASAQGRTNQPNQNAGQRQIGGGSGRGKRGVYAMASESEPAGEIITDSVAPDGEDLQDPDYVPEEEILPDAEE